MTQPQNPGSPDTPQNTSTSPARADKEERLTKQLRENLAKRKAQSRIRKTKPRKFKKNSG